MPQTETLEIHHVQNNAFVNLEVWDFPGEYTLSDSAVTDTKTLSDSNLFDHCGALVCVIDIGTYESSDDVIPTLVEWLTRAYVVFECEAREYQFSHSLTQSTHSYHLHNA